MSRADRNCSNIRERFTIDSVHFLRDFEKACVGLDASPAAAAVELGISRSQMSAWRVNGRIPGARVVLALAAYAGLNPLDYLIDLEAGNIPPAPENKPWTFLRALERIKQLEEELKRASQQA